MAKEPTAAASAGTAAALATAKTNTPAFQQSFRADPVRALQAKGIELSPTEAKLLREEVAELVNRPQGDAAIKIKIKVKIKVGVGIEV